MSEKSYAFISYSHKDGNTVKPIAMAINKNHNIWIDDTLRHGYAYDSKIYDAISQCTLFIMFVSNDYLQSEYCEKEFHVALKRSKPIYLVHLDKDIDFHASDFGKTILIRALGKHHLDNDENLVAKLSNPAISDLYLCQSDKSENVSIFIDSPVFELPVIMETQYTFMYKHDVMRLIGREREMKILDEFANNEEMFKWTMIIGAAGTGKSRLALEFAKARHREGWNAFYFNEQLEKKIKDIQKNQPFSRNTLVIFDYILSYTNCVSEYLYEQCKSQASMKHKLRVLLVDRDYQESDGEEKVGKDSFDKVIAYAQAEKSFPILARHKAELMQSMYGYDIPLFRMKPLSSMDLVEVMKQYVSHKEGNKELSDGEAKKLVNQLARIDPRLNRPLFALFIAESWLEDKPLQNLDNTLEVILSSEVEKRWMKQPDPKKNRDDHVLSQAFKTIMAYVTVHGSVEFNKAKKVFLNEFNIIQKQMAFDEDELAEHLRLAGLLDNHSSLLAIRPDILGEYLVLTWLLDNPDMVEKLFTQDWYADSALRQFTENMYIDFEDQLLKIPSFKSRLFLDEKTMGSLPVEALAMYRDAVVEIGERTKGASVHAIETLEHMYTIHNNTDMAKYLSNTLWWLMIPSDQKDRIKAKELMFTAYKEYNEPTVASGYAKCLFNLSFDQDLKGKKQTVKELCEVYQQHRTSEVAGIMTRMLANLTAYQGLGERKHTVEELRKVYQQHGTDEVACAMTVSLANLTVVQNLKGSKRTVKEICKVYYDHKTNEVAKQLASGLVNLTVDQNLKERICTVNNLRKVYQQHGTDEVAQEMARGLANLTIDQGLDGGQITVEELHKVYQEHRTHVVAQEVTRGLANLTAYQNIKGRISTVNNLRMIYQQHNTDEVAENMTQGLINLALEVNNRADHWHITVELGDMFREHTTPVIGEYYWKLMRCVLHHEYENQSTDRVYDNNLPSYIDMLRQVIEGHELLCNHFPNNQKYARDLDALRKDLAAREEGIRALHEYLFKGSDRNILTGEKASVKIEKAVKRYGDGIASEEVIGVTETSLFGVKGVLFTKSGIRRSYEDCRWMDYQNIADAKLLKRGVSFSIVDGEQVVCDFGKANKSVYNAVDMMLKARRKVMLQPEEA